MGADERNGFGLRARDMATIQEILKRFPVISSVNIFGSRATGIFRPGSDIDLSIMNEGVDPSALHALKEQFEESSLPYRVEIHYYPTLSDSDFKSSIDKTGKRFYP